MLTPDDNTDATDDRTGPGRVEADLRAAATAGAPGSRLPSVRELARRHGASPVTVQRALASLQREGLLEARPGAGTFVAARPAPARGADVAWQTATLGSRPLPGEGLSELTSSAPEGVVSLASGYPDQTLWATALLTAAASRAVRRPDSWGWSPAQGLEPLRSWFAAEAGGGVRPDDVVVVGGGQAALSAAFRSLAAPGDPVVVEAPTYVGAIDAARLAGLRPVPIPCDADGMRTDLLGATLRSSGARLVYVQPRLANPTGARLATERRAELLACAREAGAFVVEDDFACDLDPTSARPLVHDDRDGHVVHVRSLTKSAAPALRICGVVARGPAMARMRNARLVDDFFVSAVLQETAIGVVTAPGWPRHLARVRKLVAERMALAEQHLHHVPGVAAVRRPVGGFLLWVRLEDGLDDLDVARRARAAGVIVSPGRRWFVSEPDAPFLRLSVAATPPATIAEAMRRLGEALADA